MSESIHSLQMEYLMEQEKARLDREKNGDYTKAGLRHLVNSARVQLRLAEMATGDSSEQHRKIAYKLIRESHANMVRLGMIRLNKTVEKQAVLEALAGSSVEENLEPVTPSEETKDPYVELQELIGLSQVKKTIDSTLNLLNANENRKKNHQPILPYSLHMVFIGNAGTGKTTVARLVASIYKNMGLLSKGHLVEVSSSDLIAGYVGQTGTKTQEIIEKAKGGVLFIDEAYALADNKFGQDEAIPALLLGMENNRSDLAVIVAGYTDKMNDFIKSNQGLFSRFGEIVRFDDYSPEDMLEIFKCMCTKTEQFLTPAAEAELKELLKRKANEPDFGNARGVRNLFQQANSALADRVMSQYSPGSKIAPEILSTFEKADIEEAAARSDSHRL